MALRPAELGPMRGFSADDTMREGRIHAQRRQSRPKKGLLPVLAEPPPPCSGRRGRAHPYRPLGQLPEYEPGEAQVVKRTDKRAASSQHSGSGVPSRRVGPPVPLGDTSGRAVTEFRAGFGQP